MPIVLPLFQGKYTYFLPLFQENNACFCRFSKFLSIVEGHTTAIKRDGTVMENTNFRKRTA
jgi:hypothetical protein